MPNNNDAEPGDADVLYRDDYLMVRRHGKPRHVTVYVGNPPDESTPTVVDAKDLYDALEGYLDDGQ